MVVTVAKRRHTIRLPPKNSMIFFENPLTASSRFSYIVHFTSPFPKTVAIFRSSLLYVLAMAISSTAHIRNLLWGSCCRYYSASKNINCPLAADIETKGDIRTVRMGSRVNNIQFINGTAIRVPLVGINCSGKIESRLSFFPVNI